MNSVYCEIRLPRFLILFLTIKKKTSNLYWWVWVSDIVKTHIKEQVDYEQGFEESLENTKEKIKVLYS